MGQVVSQVTDQETRHERSHPFRGFEQDRQNKVKQSNKYQRQRDADRKRHHQACLILRLGMMDAVEQEENAFLAWRGRVMVEQKAMQGVLSQGPQEQADEKTQQEYTREGRSGTCQ